MISAFRGYLNTWVVRLLFVILVAAFAVWGVGDVIRNIGHTSWVAKIGDRTIEPTELQEAYRRQLAQVTRMLGAQTEPTPEIRRSVASQTLDRLIIQAAIANEEQRLGIVVPEEALRQAVFALPAFKGPDGAFSRPAFEAVLRSNNLTEGQFLRIMAGELANRQLLESVRAGAVVPDVLARAAYAFQNEKRSAEYVEYPFSAAPAPPEPTEAQLRRWWENHPERYSSPEYRRIKAVILSTQTLAKDMTVTDAELRAAYDARRSEFVTPERRSVQVVQTPDEARAKELLDAWKAGADWTRMQQEAQAAGGSAIELTDATKQEIPLQSLADAAFGTAADTVAGPVATPLGFGILKVTKVVPGADRSFEEAKDEVRDRLLAEKAADLMYDRANKVDNILGTGASLDELPNDLGLVAVAGTLDANGDTIDGRPAPIPAAPEVKSAIVTAAFQLRKDDPPRLTEVQTPAGSAYYAVHLEDLMPSERKPFDTVQGEVLEDWTRDARRRAQEEAAAKLLSAVQGGQSFDDAATVAGVTVRTTPLTGRAEPASGMPQELVQPLFGLKQGEATMVETPEGFIVATPAEIVTPDAKDDPARFAELRLGLQRAMATDIELGFAQALRRRADPRVNQALLDQIAQP